jgi:hypothetical protein
MHPAAFAKEQRIKLYLEQIACFRKLLGNPCSIEVYRRLPTSEEFTFRTLGVAHRDVSQVSERLIGRSVWIRDDADIDIRACDLEDRTIAIDHGMLAFSPFVGPMRGFDLINEAVQIELRRPRDDALDRCRHVH